MRNVLGAELAVLSLAASLGCGGAGEKEGGAGGAGSGGGAASGESHSAGRVASSGGGSGMPGSSGGPGGSPSGAGGSGGGSAGGSAGGGAGGGLGAGASGGNGGSSGTSAGSETGGAGATAQGGAAGSSAGASAVNGAAGHSGSSGAAGTGAAGSSGGAGGGSAQACPLGTPAPAAGDTTVMIQHGGRSRRYILHVPAGLSAGTPVALVFDLHGAGGNGAQQKGLSGFSSLADTAKFLAVFPDGIDGYWNVDDKCCGTAGKEKIDDVGFLRAIIDELAEDICIDAKRIFATGFSNGGGLTHRLGCDAGDVIAAIAPVATDLRTQPCNAVRPISMLEVRGMADSLEPYEGGLVGPEGGQYVAVGAKESLRLWAELNQCTGTATDLDEYCETFTQCGDGVEADLCSLPNVDHNPYDNALGFDIARVAWDMFERQPMK